MPVKLTAGQRRALRMLARVIDQQANEEPNRWYRWKKREAAGKALAQAKPKKESSEWSISRHRARKE